MYFELQHSVTENEFRMWQIRHIDYPLHIQRSFEYVAQVHGSTEVRIEDKKYLLKSGDAVLIFPLQPHSYTCVENGEVQLCIFSPEIVHSFYKANENKIPVNNKFCCVLPSNAIFDNLFQKKAIAYYICGEFEKKCKYAQKSSKHGDNILILLLLYANNHFRDRCLLQEAAIEIGYDYAYISKSFKNKVGFSIRQYVNCLRIMESKRLLRFTAKSIAEISEECGFGSIRAFNREFFAKIGTPPSNYRKNACHTFEDISPR